VSEELAGRLARLVEGWTGIVLGRDRRASIVVLCTRRSEALGLAGAEEYLDRLEREGASGAESISLLSAITNGETSFYRDQRQFAAIETFVRDRGRSREATLQIWSAGCASGEEPYSLAISGAVADVPVSVLGTDINPQFLRLAQEATYSQRALRNLPSTYRERFFTDEPPGVRPTLLVRDRVYFHRANLLDRFPPRSGRADGRWDLILCRNVFIYFDRRTVAAVVSRFMEALLPDGLLFIGAAESLHGLDVPATPVNVEGVWAYAARRPGDKAVPAPLPPAPPRPAERRRPAGDRHPVSRLAPERKAPEELSSFRAIGEWLHAAPRAEAEQKLSKLLEYSPQHVWAHLYRGFLALRAGDTASALESFERALAADPLVPEVHYCLAVAHRRLGDRVQLTEALRSTVFLAPRFWPALLLQAGLFREAGRNDLAVATYRRILEIVGTRRRDEEAFELDLPDLDEVALYRDEVLAFCRRSVAELDPDIRSEGRDGSRGPSR
jgi:chemotaxis protein methyltransferase CheR